MTQYSKVEPWDGEIKSGEELQTKLMVFKSSQLSIFAQEGVTDAVITKRHIRVGEEGVDMQALVALHGERLVEKTKRAWHLLIAAIRYMPVLNQILTKGSPSEGWEIFVKYYTPDTATEKSRLTTQWYAFHMTDDETPQSYFGRFSVLRARLVSHGTVFTGDEAHRHLVRNLSHTFCFQQSILLLKSNLTMSKVEEVITSAHGEMELQREKKDRTGTGYALAACGAGRGSGGVQNGRQADGGRGDGQEQGQDWRNGEDLQQRLKWCTFHNHLRSRHRRVQGQVQAGGSVRPAAAAATAGTAATGAV